MTLSVLIVVAHPDDEALGCGGTAAALAKHGHDVRSCILSGAAEARNARPELEELERNTRDAQLAIGLEAPILGSFPNIKFNTVPHLELVQFIENAIEQTAATVIFTHHPADLNNDHLHTSIACQAAARLFQRRPAIAPLRALYFMEVPSATDWAFAPADGAFQPNTYVDIEATLQVKLEALRCYKGIMRSPPHSRSEEVLRALACARGAQAGMHAAEAFQAVFRAHWFLEDDF